MAKDTENSVIAAVRADSVSHENLDFFIYDDVGFRYAGTHLTLDLWGASGLDDIDLIRATLHRCAVACGATILHAHVHHFTPNGGVSGVVVLSESHISIHTWPERDFAALDIFMCGDAQPKKAIPILKHAFTPDRMLLNDLKRGMQDDG